MDMDAGVGLFLIDNGSSCLWVRPANDRVRNARSWGTTGTLGAVTGVQRSRNWLQRLRLLNCSASLIQFYFVE
jgi:hypothetical protein